MPNSKYLMESAEETTRLDLKTDSKIVEKQAIWAGIKPGMRVADLGCGSGKTTSVLHKLVQPDGEVVGIDFAKDRIEYAKKHYKVDGIEFKCIDIKEPMDELGLFDFIWVRFVLEYYRADSMDIVKNANRILKPGGIICLVDLDHNALNHYGYSKRLERTIFAITKILEEKANFDPYIGRKLYSYLYDLGYKDIDVDVNAHHIIFGELKNIDAYNWIKKLEVIPKKINYEFKEYEGGYEEFLAESKSFFSDPRRFTYTPIISCRGEKPV
ncbi:MAG: class I SAM-dependent methyltransferase [Thermodesulfovibrionia bacterium]|nr:class I SAM-dependent methyltransferase [Thermodesulfovibrionia bacterium]